MSIIVTSCLFLICIATLIVSDLLGAKFRREWQKNLMKLIVVTFASTLGSYLWKAVIELPQREKEEKFKRQLIAILSESSSKTQDMEELLSLKYKEIFRMSEEESRVWVEEFRRSLAEKRKDLKIVSVKGKEMADRLSIRWNPFYQYILKQFDDRVQGLAQDDHGTSITKNNLKLVFVDNFSGIDETIRRTTFPNNNSIIAKMRPAQVERGILVDTPRIDFLVSVPGEFQEAALSIVLTEKGASVHATNSRYVPLMEDATTDQDPLIDERFRRIIADSIGKLITFVYLRNQPE